jgi:DNA polymerase-3 subunit alpha
LAGFTGGQADTLRKAVGKKIIEMMRKVKPEFIDGAVKHSNADRKDMEKFWAQLEEFANYCFNKSHAACYGLIAYWTAYLKAHYPDAFMAALMTSDADDIDRLAIEITECKHMGIEVLAPDVNQSFVEFAVVPGEKKIRFGMAAVKGVGVGAVEEILRAREDGEFTSIEDFAKRVSTSKFNKKAWESLIKSGGFDRFGDRSDLLYNLETVQSFASKVQKEAASGQTDLFAGMLGGNTAVHASISLQTSPAKHTDKERLTWERELLGLYISAHPLDNYDTYFEEQTVPLAALSPDNDNQKATIGGIVTTLRTIVTKNGSKMAFAGIEDKTGESEITIFPDLFSQVGGKLSQDTVLRASGKINARDRDGNRTSEVKIIADEIMVVSEKELVEYESTGRSMKAPKAKRAVQVTKTLKQQPDAERAPVQPEALKVATIYVHVADPNNQTALQNLKTICSKNPGTSDVILVLGDTKKSAIKLPFKIDNTQSVIDALCDSLGKEAVSVK